MRLLETCAGAVNNPPRNWLEVGYGGWEESSGVGSPYRPVVSLFLGGVRPRTPAVRDGSWGEGVWFPRTENGEFSEEDVKGLLKDKHDHGAEFKSLRYPGRVGTNYAKTDDLSCYKVHPSGSKPAYWEYKWKTRLEYKEFDSY